jgi:hypothetical protein
MNSLSSSAVSLRRRIRDLDDAALIPDSSP